MVTVTVSDGTLTDTIIVTINVTDLEEVGESIVQQPEQSPPYARDRAKEFDTLQAAGNERPHGIWSDGTTLWVADAADAKIYAYRMPSQPAAKAQALIGLPDEPQLQQNAPNPFNSQTVLSYFSAEIGSGAPGTVLGDRAAGGGPAPGAAAGRLSPPPLECPRRRRPPLGQWHLLLPTGDRRGHLDAQAHPTALI